MPVIAIAHQHEVLSRIGHFQRFFGQLRDRAVGQFLTSERSTEAVTATTTRFAVFPHEELLRVVHRHHGHFSAVQRAGDVIVQHAFFRAFDVGGIAFLAHWGQCLDQLNAGDDHVVSADILRAAIALLHEIRDLVSYEFELFFHCYLIFSHY